MTIVKFNEVLVSDIKDVLARFESYYYEANPVSEGSRQSELPAAYGQAKRTINDILSLEPINWSDQHRNIVSENLQIIIDVLDSNVKSKLSKKVRAYRQELTNQGLSESERNVIKEKKSILIRVYDKWENNHQVEHLGKDELQLLQTNRGWGGLWGTRADSEQVYQAVRQAVPVYQSIVHIKGEWESIQPPGQVPSDEDIEMQILTKKSGYDT